MFTQSVSGDGSGFFCFYDKCLVTDQGGYGWMSVLMGTQGGIQNKNSYRPHVRSGAGYDIPGFFTAATKAAVGSRIWASLLFCAFLCCVVDALS